MTDKKESEVVSESISDFISLLNAKKQQAKQVSYEQTCDSTQEEEKSPAFDQTQPSEPRKRQKSIEATRKLPILQGKTTTFLRKDQIPLNKHIQAIAKFNRQQAISDSIPIELIFCSTSASFTVQNPREPQSNKLEMIKGKPRFNEKSFASSMPTKLADIGRQTLLSGKNSFRINTNTRGSSPWGHAKPTNSFQYPKYLRFRPFLEDLSTWRSPFPAQYDRGYSFKFINGEIKLIKCTLESNDFVEKGDGNPNWTIAWNIGPIRNEVYTNMFFFQKVNHFPFTNEITRKDNMARNISIMQKNYPGHFSFIPKTFILPNDREFLIRDFEQNQNGASGAKGNRIYISKPPGGSQGRGIFVSDSIDELLSYPHNVVSHYVADPLLIEGYKFDLRIYVLITSVDPLIIYVYNEGLTRLATEKYVSGVGEEFDPFMHLTNFSLNKASEKFYISEENDGEGNKRSLSWFGKWMDDHNVNSRVVFSRIDDLVIKTILSIEDKIFSKYSTLVPFRNNCFELLGFDVLIDKSLNPWLLEVNLSPSLGAEAWFDQKVKSHLLADIFSLAGIQPIDQRKIDDFNVNKGFNVYLKEGGNYPGASGASNGTSFKDKEEYLANKLCELLQGELKRKGQFRLVYPGFTVADYKQYFQNPRQSNEILREL